MKVKVMHCTKCAAKRWFTSGYDGRGFFNRCCRCKARFEGVAKAFGRVQRLSAEARKEKMEQEALEDRGQMTLAF